LVLLLFESRIIEEGSIVRLKKKAFVVAQLIAPLTHIHVNVATWMSLK